MFQDLTDRIMDRQHLAGRTTAICPQNRLTARALTRGQAIARRCKRSTENSDDWDFVTRRMNFANVPEILAKIGNGADLGLISFSRRQLNIACKSGHIRGHKDLSTGRDRGIESLVKYLQSPAVESRRTGQ